MEGQSAAIRQKSNPADHSARRAIVHLRSLAKLTPVDLIDAEPTEYNQHGRCCSDKRLFNISTVLTPAAAPLGEQPQQLGRGPFHQGARGLTYQRGHQYSNRRNNSDVLLLQVSHLPTSHHSSHSPTQLLLQSKALTRDHGTFNATAHIS